MNLQKREFKKVTAIFETVLIARCVCMTDILCTIKENKITQYI